MSGITSVPGAAPSAAPDPAPEEPVAAPAPAPTPPEAPATAPLLPTRPGVLGREPDTLTPERADAVVSRLAEFRYSARGDMVTGEAEGPDGERLAQLHAISEDSDEPSHGTVEVVENGAMPRYLSPDETTALADALHREIERRQDASLPGADDLQKMLHVVDKHYGESEVARLAREGAATAEAAASSLDALVNGAPTGGGVRDAVAGALQALGLSPDDASFKSKLDALVGPYQKYLDSLGGTAGAVVGAAGRATEAAAGLFSSFLTQLTAAVAPKLDPLLGKAESLTVDGYARIRAAAQVKIIEKALDENDRATLLRTTMSLSNFSNPDAPFANRKLDFVTAKLREDGRFDDFFRAAPRGPVELAADLAARNGAPETRRAWDAAMTKGIQQSGLTDWAQAGELARWKKKVAEGGPL
jgi:hypothetical protein